MTDQFIVVLSGAIASGKSTLAVGLAEHGFRSVKTNELIQHYTKKSLSERGQLQRAGDRLDRDTDCQWIVDAIASLPDYAEHTSLVVDSVRKQAQIDAIRRAYGKRVVHIHLLAPDEVLSDRYIGRDSAIKEFETYEEARRNRTEKEVGKLRETADAVIDTNRCTKEDVIVRALSRLGMYGSTDSRLVDIIVGGQYGSEGKGQVAAEISGEYDYLVRVGGPNAGHSVYAEPKKHKFHHLPSGTTKSSAKLILGPGAVLFVENLQKEISEYGVDADRLLIDRHAMIIDPSDREIESNTLKAQIASTAQGVGVATIRKIWRKNADPPVRQAKDIDELQPYLCDAVEILETAFADGKRVLLEGTQGTQLSLHHGTYPFVTSRDTTASGCLAESGISPNRVRRIVMVCRTYPIRVKGDSGPMQKEIGWHTVAERSGIPLDELKETELTTTTGNLRRVGEFEWTGLRRAASLNSPTDIAVTFVDYLDIDNRKARRYEQLSEDTMRFIEEVETVTGAPVSLISTRFHHRSIIDRRKW